LTTHSSRVVTIVSAPVDALASLASREKHRDRLLLKRKGLHLFFITSFPIAFAFVAHRPPFLRHASHLGHGCLAPFSSLG
jgi:hypothetical protein